MASHGKPFDRTKKAAGFFADLISCTSCKQKCTELQHLGSACKHAFCWDCINRFSTSMEICTCSRCFSPLEVAKPTPAKMFNSLATNIAQFNQLLEQYEMAIRRGGNTNEVLQTQNLFSKDFECPPQRTVEEFIESQQCVSNYDEVGLEKSRSVTPASDPVPTEIVISKENTPIPILEPEVEEHSVSREKTPSSPARLPTPSLRNSRKRGVAIVPKIMKGTTQKPDFFQTQQIFSKSPSPEFVPIIPIRTTKNFEFSKKPAATFGDTKKTVSNRVMWPPEFLRHSDVSPESASKDVSQKKGDQTPVNTVAKRKSSVKSINGPSVLKAVSSDCMDTVKKAIDEDGDINEVHPDLGTPLCIAVRNGNLDMCQMLIENGAVINAHCGEECNTALHIAVEMKNAEIVKYLLSKGASQSIRNIRGCTAVEMVSTSSPLRTIVQKYRKYPRQPSIPPPLPKEYLVVIDEGVQLTERNKKILTDMITIVTGKDRSTHYVITTDSEGTAEASLELLGAMLRGSFIVSHKWLMDSIERRILIEDSLKYEVKQLKYLDGEPVEGGVMACRRSKERIEPGLFRGCKFYVAHSRLSPYGHKIHIQDLIKAAEGTVLGREPLKDDNDPLPFHAHRLELKSPYFVVYDYTTTIAKKFHERGYYNLVTAGWIFDCLLRYEFVKTY